MHRAGVAEDGGPACARVRRSVQGAWPRTRSRQRPPRRPASHAAREQQRRRRSGRSAHDRRSVGAGRQSLGQRRLLLELLRPLPGSIWRRSRRAAAYSAASNAATPSAPSACLSAARRVAVALVAVGQVCSQLLTRAPGGRVRLDEVARGLHVVGVDLADSRPGLVGKPQRLERLFVGLLDDPLVVVGHQQRSLHDGRVLRLQRRRLGRRHRRRSGGSGRRQRRPERDCGVAFAARRARAARRRRCSSSGAAP